MPDETVGGRHAVTLPPAEGDPDTENERILAPLREEPVRRRRRRRRGNKVTRFVRRHKVLTIVFGLAFVLLVALVLWLIWLNSKLEDIPRFPFESDQTPRVAGGSQNILLIGVDDPEAKEDLFSKLESGTWTPGEFRSDSIMVLHIDGDHRSAQLVSIPRDSFVDVPDAGRTKINAAFSYGGPSELSQVVSQVTGIHIDHAVVIDFTHFADMTTALGGVDLYVPGTVVDPATGATWKKGPIHLEGADALAYVRERKGLPRGDFDRIQRQQNLLRALLVKATDGGTLANPFRVTSLVTRLQNFVAVDDAFTSSRIRSLAISSRHIRAGNMRYLTIPYTGTPTIDDASVVTIDLTKTKAMFDALAHDRIEDWLAKNPVDSLPPVDQVK